MLILGLSPYLSSCVECGHGEVAGYSSVVGGGLCRACYSGDGFAVTESALELSKHFRDSDLSEAVLGSSESDIRILGRIYKEQFMEHLGLGPDFFRRVLSPKKERPLGCTRS